MSWYLFTANHTAHIHPDLTNGTALAGFPITNVRTPAVNVRAQISADITNGVQIDWDRGTASGSAVDSVLVLANNMTTSTLDILSDTVDTFASPTTLLTTSTHSTPDFFRRLTSTSSERYLRFDYQNTSGTFKYGLIAIGRSFELPAPQIASEKHSADGEIRVRSQSFRNVPTADMESIIDHMNRHYIWAGTGGLAKSLIEAIGGHQDPVALIDTGGAAGSETIYYGLAKAQARPSVTGAYEVSVTMRIVREGVFL